MSELINDEAVTKARLDALTDGVFAFAMTLFVVKFDLPEDFHPKSAAELRFRSPWPRRHSVERRPREFVTARRCVREGLAKLGRPPTPIRSGPMREPQSLAGLVGNITHIRAFGQPRSRPEASSRTSASKRPNCPLPDGSRSRLPSRLSPRCWPHWLGRSWSRTGADCSTTRQLIYCEAWYPSTGRWLGFEDARLTIGPTPGTFAQSGQDREAARIRMHGRNPPLE
jgi:hypothetical protein